MDWNKPSTENQKKKTNAKAPSAKRGIIVGAVVVVALYALYLWVFSGGDDVPAPSTKHKSPGAIKAVVPAAAPTNKLAEVKKPIDPREDYDHTKMYRDERGILRYNSGARAPDPTRPCKKPVVLGSNERTVFRHPTERMIANLLVAQPGEKRFFTPDYYAEGFEEDFRESLKEKIEFTDNDLPHEKELKKAMIEVKEDLRKRLAAGEKLGDILTETSKELERLGEYKDQLKQQMNDIVIRSDGGMSEADIKDLVGAANKMLEENGADPVEVDEFVIWNMRLSAEKSGKTPEETEAVVDEYNARRTAEEEAKKNSNQK